MLLGDRPHIVGGEPLVEDPAWMDDGDGTEIADSHTSGFDHPYLAAQPELIQLIQQGLSDVCFAGADASSARA
jgi:hypothetical protein